MHRLTTGIARLWNAGCLGKLAIGFAGLVVLGCIGAALAGRPAVAPSVLPATAAPAAPIAGPTVVPTAAPLPTSAPAATAARTTNPEGVAPAGGDCPADYPVKGNIRGDGQRLYHVPGSAAYARTKPERCFATAADAEAAGFRRPEQ